MLFNLSNLMYMDKFSTSRLQGVKQANLSIKQSLAPVEGLQDIPCYLSSRQKDTPADQKADVNPTDIIYTMFCDRIYNILPGDTLTISHLGKTDVYIAGKSARYVNHQEVLLQQVGEA